ncbi:MAG: PBP1A family penicillin-binding protein [Candidatus Latescibacterota bacterium]|jgi:penicillin-binding protein 1A
MEEKIPRKIPLAAKILGGLAVLVAGTIFGAYQYFSRDLPSTARLEMIEPSLKTEVYAEDLTLIGEFYVEDRALVPLEDIPQYLIDAIVAVEDRKFYSHWGVDIFGIARELVTNLKEGEIVQGGSTITQQLARNLFDMYENTLSRKIKEALLAVRIERAYSKDEILEMYLNQIYFGSGAHGVEAAARVFFGKHASDLTIGEATLLAGIPKNPRDYSPIYHLERALQRRSVVLQAMVDKGSLFEEDAERIDAEPVETKSGRDDKPEFAAYFLEEVRRYLEQKYGADRLYHDGLRVYTGLDYNVQKAAEDSMETHLRRMETYGHHEFTKERYDTLLARGEAEGPPDYMQGAVIAIDVRTGFIKALVGGRSFEQSKWNRATQAKRQPGSAFKPFIYLSAIENGYTPADIILDAPVVLDLPNGDVWKPSNFTERFEGEVSLRHALNFSINIAAIRLLMALGPISAINYAHRLGIKSDLENVYALALGVSEVSLLELTSAYATIAAGGIRFEPLLVKKVVDREGKVLEENFTYREEVLDAQSNYMITNMMESVVNEGYGRTARRMGFKSPAAGKTGTTDDCTDAWFVGFTPEIAVGVWAGFDQKRSMGRRMTGGRVACPIWTNVMMAYYGDRVGDPFPEPEGIVHRVICEKSGLLMGTACSEVRREVFIEGTEPRRYCDRHPLSTASPEGAAASYEDLDRSLLDGD